MKNQSLVATLALLACSPISGQQPSEPLPNASNSTSVVVRVVPSDMLVAYPGATLDAETYVSAEQGSPLVDMRAAIRYEGAPDAQPQKTLSFEEVSQRSLMREELNASFAARIRHPIFKGSSGFKYDSVRTKSETSKVFRVTVTATFPRCFIDEAIVDVELRRQIDRDLLASCYDKRLSNEERLDAWARFRKFVGTHYIKWIRRGAQVSIYYTCRGMSEAQMKSVSAFLHAKLGKGPVKGYMNADFNKCLSTLMELKNVTIEVVSSSGVDTTQIERAIGNDPYDLNGIRDAAFKCIGTIKQENAPVVEFCAVDMCGYLLRRNQPAFPDGSRALLRRLGILRDSLAAELQDIRMVMSAPEAYDMDRKVLRAHEEARVRLLDAVRRNADLASDGKQAAVLPSADGLREWKTPELKHPIRYIKQGHRWNGHWPVLTATVAFWLPLSVESCVITPHVRVDKGFRRIHPAWGPLDLTGQASNVQEANGEVQSGLYRINADPKLTEAQRRGHRVNIESIAANSNNDAGTSVAHILLKYRLHEEGRLLTYSAYWDVANRCVLKVDDLGTR